MRGIPFWTPRAQPLWAGAGTAWAGASFTHRQATRARCWRFLPTPTSDVFRKTKSLFVSMYRQLCLLSRCKPATCPRAGTHRIASLRASLGIGGWQNSEAQFFWFRPLLPDWTSSRWSIQRTRPRHCCSHRCQSLSFGTSACFVDAKVNEVNGCRLWRQRGCHCGPLVVIAALDPQSMVP